MNNHLSNKNSHTGMRSVNLLMKYLLTHWGQDKIPTIFQTTFSSPFSSMKIIVFCFKFQVNVVPRVQINNKLAFGLVTNRWQAIIWTNASLVHWCIHVSLGLIGLKPLYMDSHYNHRWLINIMWIPILVRQHISLKQPLGKFLMSSFHWNVSVKPH